MQHRTSSQQGKPVFRPAGRGMTLLEAALGMMILAVLSVGVSSLVKASIETQLSKRSHANMQTVAMNIVDDLRMDLRTATTVQVQNGGNTLNIDNNAIVYQLTGANNFTRTEQATGATKTYNDANIFRPQLQVNCPGGCFQALMPNNDPTPLPRQVLVNAIEIQQVMPNGNAGTIIDQNFGAARFAIRQTAFDIISAKEFQ